MPGFRDNRGIDLELAQVIVMKKVVEYAKSVRLVMVFERDNICPEKGSKIKAAADLLEKRFNYNVGKKPGSLSLVVTKTTGQDKIDTIKKEIAEKTSDCSIDLSPHAIIYDPLDVNDKDRLLNIIFSNKNYIGLEASIGIDKDSLWDARDLGKEVEEGVQKHLNKKPEEEIEKNKEEEEMLQAVKKLEFTYGIANLGNPDLTNLHESAQKAVRKYAEKIIREIKPKATYTISKANALKKYDILREKFKPFVPFDDLNEGLRENIDLMDDPKAWYERAWLYIRKHTVGISQKEQEERYFFGWKP